MVTKTKIKILKPKSSEKQKMLKRKKAVPEKTGLIDKVPKTKIKVIGIGGGGGSIIAELAANLRGIDFIAVNTDSQALKVLSSKIKTFHFGRNLTRGLGTGMSPKIGEEAVREAKEELKSIFSGVDLVILVACLGGGTGSGAAPVFAEISRELGSIAFGIFTLPFEFEGEKRTKIAQAALEKLKTNIDGLAIVSNDKVFDIIDKDTPLQGAFSAVNKILAKSLDGLIETIYRPGLINIDFADLKTVLVRHQFLAKDRAGLVFLNCSEAEGESRVIEAVKNVLHNPLQDYEIKGAERILFNIAGDKSLRMAEVEEIARTIADFSPEARVIFGISQSPKLKNKIRVTLLAVHNQELEKKKEQKVKDKAKKGGRALFRKKQEKQCEADKKDVEAKADKTGQERAQIKTGRERPPAVHLSQNNDRDDEGEAGTPERERDSRHGEAAVSERQSSLLRAPRVISKEQEMRRNGLQLKRETEKIERELVKQEEAWEVPTFLRRISKIKNQNAK